VSDYVKTILRDLGIAIHIPGLMALVTLPICVVFGEPYAVVPFLLTAAISILLGQLLYRRFRGAEEMHIRHAMDTAVLAWIVIPLIAALPVVLIAAGLADAPPTVLQFRHPLNALFEAVSGFTSTGLTVTLHPAELPHSLQWWRSFMQWIGGVGVIVLMLSVFHPQADAHRLYFAEARQTIIGPTVVSTVRTIWWIYLLYTAVTVLALHAAGLPWWEAVNYGMTGIATGGFGMTDGNIGDFGWAPRLVMTAVMIVGSISFATHHRLLRRGGLAWLWRDGEVRWLFVLLGSGAALLVGENLWSGRSSQWFEAVFHWASALCTAGFQFADLAGWSPTAHLLLVVAMVFGGAAGSTAGGLKLSRVALLARGALHRIERVARQPWRLVEHRPIGDPNEAQRQRRNLEAAAILAVLWVVTLLGGALVLLHVAAPTVTLGQALLEAASALGNVGLSAGLTSPDLPAAGKLTLMTIMWMGRLEIIPVLVLLAALGGRRGSSHR
jgi:trk system potassium uptake protein TrkH